MLFCHKINITTGKSHLIFDCIMEEFNPVDNMLGVQAADNLKKAEHLEAGFNDFPQ